MKMKALGILPTLILVSTLISGFTFSASTGKIYFSDSNNSGNAVAKVLRANLDGSDVKLLVTPPSLNPRYIALDIAGGKVYWTDIGSIRRANLDGSNVENSLVHGLPGPSGIALNLMAGKIYWTAGVTNKIQRSNLDGSNIEDIVTGLGDPRGLAININAGKIYWTDTLTDKIQRANLDGSELEDLVSGQSFPQGIALDVPRGRMYWAQGNWIWSAKLDGTDANPEFQFSGAIGIALDLKDRKIYWTNNNDNKIQRANFDGTLIEDLVTSGLDTPWGIALQIPTAIKVTIDLKPGNRKNTINLNSAGVTHLAILSSQTFDALTIDEETIWLSGANVRLAGRNYMCQERDVNRDGFMDLVCGIETSKFMIEQGEYTVELTAVTEDGIQIRGTDLIKIVPSLVKK